MINSLVIKQSPSFKHYDNISINDINQILEKLIDFNQNYALFSQIIYEFPWGTSEKYQDVIEEFTLQYGNKKLIFRETTLKISPFCM